MTSDLAILDATDSDAVEGAPFIVFSIASRNYMCFVNTLHESLTRQYGAVRFYLALADADEGIDRSDIPYDILSLADLEDDRLWGMAERYNITEFNTSIKPFVFAHLMARFPGTPILYFDPDILVLSRLTEVEEAFAGGANAILTPHLTSPLDHELSRDEALLKFGIYNLGFVGLFASPEVQRIVSWWCDRMEHRCLIDFPNGLFVDQKWCDFIPAYLSETHILRHPGYNVAYWNLPGREIQSADGRWTSNGEDLRFVHFSGVDILNPSIYSRHAPNLHHAVVGDLRYLLEYYREKVLANGLKRYGLYEYAFRFNGASGAINVHTSSSLSDRIKGDVGIVDHALPAFGPQGRAVADSLGRTDAAPPLLIGSIDGPEQLAVWRKRNADALVALRSYEKDRLREAEDVAIFGGVCAICRTTTPFLAPIARASRDRGCDWEAGMTCRCGHAAGMRAIVHAGRSIAGLGPLDPIIIDDGGRGDGETWARLQWPLSRSYRDCSHGQLARAVLVAHFKASPQAVADRLAAYAALLAPGGLLILSCASSAEQTPDFSLLPALGEAGLEDARCLVYGSRELGYLGQGSHLFTASAPKA